MTKAEAQAALLAFLALLHKNPSTPIQPYDEHYRKDHPRVPVLKDLEQRGWIEPEPHVSPVRYRLTTAGTRLALSLKGAPKVRGLDFPALVAELNAYKLFEPREDYPTGVIPHSMFRPGSKASRLLLLLGANGSGKSVIRRILSAIVAHERRDDDKRPRTKFSTVGEVLVAAQDRRAGGGFASMAFGSESMLSTGAISAGILIRMIERAKACGTTSVCLLDEPDLGMANGAAVGAGIMIREFVESLEVEVPLCQGVVVTSHNPGLIRELLRSRETPHYLFVGDPEGAPESADAWVAQQLDPTPISPAELLDCADARFDVVRTVLNENRKKGSCSWAN